MLERHAPEPDADYLRLRDAGRPDARRPDPGARRSSCPSWSAGARARCSGTSGRPVGVSAKWVLARFRLQEAAVELERDPAVNLAALSARLGWHDQAHFTNDFRRMLGTTPARYAAAAARRPGGEPPDGPGGEPVCGPPRRARRRPARRVRRPGPRRRPELSVPDGSIGVVDTVRRARPRRRPPRRAGRAGLRRRAPAGAVDAPAPRAAARPDPAAAARLGERRGPRPLHAGLQPARALRPGAGRRRRLDALGAPAADAGRVLGARGEPAAGRRLAAVAVGRQAPRVVAALRGARRPGAAAGRRPARGRQGAGAGGCGGAGDGAGRPARRGRRAQAGGRGRTSSGSASSLFGTGRSPPGPGCTSSGSTTCPSASCRPRSSRAHPADPEVSARELVLRAAGALGVATEPDLRDYYRLGPAQSQRAVAELVEDGRAGAGRRCGAGDTPRTGCRARGCRGGSRRGRCCRRSTR